MFLPIFFRYTFLNRYEKSDNHILIIAFSSLSYFCENYSSKTIYSYISLKSLSTGFVAGIFTSNGNPRCIKIYCFRHKSLLPS